jgi:hypothetical protein
VFVLTAIAIVLVVGLGIAAAILFRPKDPPAPPVRLPLQVSREGGKSKYPTIQQALREAKAGDVIELWDEKHQENVTVAPTLGATFLTLRAAPGRQITWVAKDERRPLLTLSNADGFKLEGKGITLDGQDRVQDLAELTLFCPGLTVQDLGLRGFTRHAIRIMNCQGESTRRVRLANLQIELTGKHENRAAVFLDASKDIVRPAMNDCIDIVDGDFRGFPDRSAAIKKRNDDVIGSDVRGMP